MMHISTLVHHARFMSLDPHNRPRITRFADGLKASLAFLRREAWDEELLGPQWRLEGFLVESSDGAREHDYCIGLG